MKKQKIAEKLAKDIVDLENQVIDLLAFLERCKTEIKKQRET